WGPDGSISVQGTDLTGHRGIFRVDARSGNVSPILVCEPPVICVQASFTASDSTLIVRNLRSGTEVTLAHQSGVKTLDVASLSRDGSQVAYVHHDPVA